MAAQPVDEAVVKFVRTRPLIDERRELERIRPYADELARLIRERDPQATFSLEPPIDPGIWILNAFLTPPLDEDPEFLDSVRDRRVDMQIHDDVSIAIISLARGHGAVREGAGRTSTARRKSDEPAAGAATRAAERTAQPAR